MAKYKVKIEVIDIKGSGECSIGQKIGDTYNYPEDFGKMCTSSFHAIYPWIMVMLSGGSFTDEENERDFLTTGCPDYNHQVVYKISREIIKN